MLFVAFRGLISMIAALDTHRSKISTILNFRVELFSNDPERFYIVIQYHAVWEWMGS